MAPALASLTQTLDELRPRLCKAVVLFSVVFCFVLFFPPISFVAVAACMIHAEPLQIISVQFALG